MLNFSILSANLQPPVPPPEKPTGGVHATQETGGPQPGEVENGTLKLHTSKVPYSSNHISNSIRYPVVVSARKWN